jgi:hypothetical protein
MTSQGTKAIAPLATKLMLPITGCSCFESANKK